MKLSMAQISMLNNMNENYKKTLSYIEKAHGSDLLFFPELQLTPFFPQLPGLKADVALSKESDARLKGIAYQAQKHHMCISPNVYLDENGKHYDASLWFDKQGKSGRIAKMVHVMNAPHFHEADYYTPSDTGFLVHHTNFGNIGIVICFDRHYPESIRSCVCKGAELIIIPTANLKEEDLEMFVWEMRIAAYQNEVFIAMCNRVGKEGRVEFAGRSIVIGPDGNVIVEADDTEQLITVDLDLKKVKEEREKRPYLSHRQPSHYSVIAEEVSMLNSSEDGVK